MSQRRLIGTDCCPWMAGVLIIVVWAVVIGSLMARPGIAMSTAGSLPDRVVASMWGPVLVSGSWSYLVGRGGCLTATVCSNTSSWVMAPVMTAGWMGPGRGPGRSRARCRWSRRGLGMFLLAITRR